MDLEELYDQLDEEIGHYLEFDLEREIVKNPRSLVETSQCVRIGVTDHNGTTCGYVIPDADQRFTIQRSDLAPCKSSIEGEEVIDYINDEWA